MRAPGPQDAQLPYLDTFSKAAELTSFTATAKMLRLSQAAVSQRVQALEKALGRPLFTRNGGRVLLTPAGRKLYDHAQRILEQHRTARRDVCGSAAPVTGELFIAASSIPGEHLLPALLSSFGRTHPHIRVHASVSDSMDVMAQVERGEVSLGLVGRKSANSNLRFRHFANDHMVLVAPPGHALCKRKKLPVKQLARYPLILRETGSGLRNCLEKSLEKAGISVSELTVTLEVGSNQGIKESVLEGAGVAVLSTYAVMKEVKARQLHSLEITGLDCDREMFVVLDQRRVLPLAARMFLTFLESHPVSEAS
ncbi:MAG TPA: selenium metabolism-associated LysR family transcriptional regulator [Gemmataceae bacterium]|nr:selenium metabolism-associated LysR family transcriptional regulator [Gemmataceae bacterium]